MKTRFFYFLICAIGFLATPNPASAGTPQIEIDAAYPFAPQNPAKGKTRHNFHTTVPTAFVAYSDQDLDNDTQRIPSHGRVVGTWSSTIWNRSWPLTHLARHPFADAVSPPRYILFSSYLI
jgi:hypothetical protein